MGSSRRRPFGAGSSQIALTLRTLGGLSAAEIASAFLDQETTMGQRLSRAKAKIAAARIPYCVPEPGEWPERLNAVLALKAASLASQTRLCTRPKFLASKP